MRPSLPAPLAGACWSAKRLLPIHQQHHGLRTSSPTPPHHVSARLRASQGAAARAGQAVEGVVDRRRAEVEVATAVEVRQRVGSTTAKVWIRMATRCSTPDDAVRRAVGAQFQPRCPSLRAGEQSAPGLHDACRRWRQGHAPCRARAIPHWIAPLGNWLASAGMLGLKSRPEHGTENRGSVTTLMTSRRWKSSTHVEVEC